MNNIDEYLLKIKSAVEKLYEAHYSYLEILKKANGNVSPWCYGNTDREIDEQLKNWMKENKDKIIIGVSAIKEFEAEGFAQATICGAIFQLAYKAIELFSKNEDIPDSLPELNKHKKAVEKFCIGREILDVPLGLVIMLGRNIYNHYEESELREYNQLILKKFPDGQYSYVDSNESFKLNIVDNLFGYIQWRSFNDFSREIKDILSSIKTHR